MIEKQILIDQIDDRIKRALALIISMYPKIRDGEAEQEEYNGILEILESMSFFIKVIYDIQYNNNIEKYKDEIYGIARGEFDE
jgi:hypothetical protein